MIMVGTAKRISMRPSGRAAVETNSANLGQRG